MEQKQTSLNGCELPTAALQYRTNTVQFGTHGLYVAFLLGAVIRKKLYGSLNQ